MKDWKGINPPKNKLDIKKEITEVRERIFLMSFPSEDKIKELGEWLNKTYSDKYLVYNLSEHKYDTSHFQNQVRISNYFRSLNIHLVDIPTLPWTYYLESAKI